MPGSKSSQTLTVAVRSACWRRLRPIFETMLANATRICGASFGSLAVRDADGFRRIAANIAKLPELLWEV